MIVAEETWSVGKARIQGKPVVYRYLSDLPREDLRNTMPWLMVISWKYDGSASNGMPPSQMHTLMYKLEDSLENIQGRQQLYLDVYTATGNNLKEFVFYIADREAFMESFYKELEQHPDFPIEIRFYKDEHWSELANLQGGFEMQASRTLH